MEQLFFELIQVSLGTRTCLSHTPRADEWGELYAMAKKQSLVGVCFAGVQKLQTQRQEPPEMLYLTWMGMAAKIQQRNEVVNKQCMELQSHLTEEGFRSTILKGQGMACLYDDSLKMLRQSGDIDICIDGGKRMVTKVASLYGVKQPKWYFKDIELPIYADTQIEAHYIPGIFFNYFVNKKWLKWCRDNNDIIYGNCIGYDHLKITTPTLDFNVVFILVHIYRHVFDSGIGLRQLMDWYFVLKSRNTNNASTCPVYANDEDILSLFKSFGMLRFAKGIMWIMQYVFGIERDFLLCAPDEMEGKFLLKEIVKHGNFGNAERNNVNKKLPKLMHFIKKDIALLLHYPLETLSMPVYFIGYYIISKIKNI